MPNPEMKGFGLGAIFLMLLGTTGVAATPRCEVFFEEQNRLTIFNEVIAYNPARIALRSSVQAMGQFQDHNNSTIHRMQRTRSSWESGYAFENNGQGDLRTFSLSLGRKTSEFFRHKLISNKEIHIPDAKSLNAASDIYNQDLPLKDLLLVRFFGTGNFAFENKEFIRQWFLFLKYPLAEEGFYQIHDGGFHHLAITLPREIALYSARAYGILYDFMEYLKIDEPHVFKNLKIDEEAYWKGLADHLDALGDLHVMYDPSSNRRYSRMFFHETFMFEGKTPEQVLISYWKKNMPSRLQKYIPLRMRNFLNERGELRSFDEIEQDAVVYSYTRTHQIFIEHKKNLQKRGETLYDQNLGY